MNDSSRCCPPSLNGAMPLSGDGGGGGGGVHTRERASGCTPAAGGRGTEGAGGREGYQGGEKWVAGSAGTGALLSGPYQAGPFSKADGLSSGTSAGFTFSSLAGPGRQEIAARCTAPVKTNRGLVGGR